MSIAILLFSLLLLEFTTSLLSPPVGLASHQKEDNGELRDRDATSNANAAVEAIEMTDAVVPRFVPFQDDATIILRVVTV